MTTTTDTDGNVADLLRALAHALGEAEASSDSAAFSLDNFAQVHNEEFAGELAEIYERARWRARLDDALSGHELQVPTGLYALQSHIGGQLRVDRVEVSFDGVGVGEWVQDGTPPDYRWLFRRYPDPFGGTGSREG